MCGFAAPRRGTLTADAYCEAAADGWLEDVMAAQSRSDFAFRESGVDLGADEFTLSRSPSPKTPKQDSRVTESFCATYMRSLEPEFTCAILRGLENLESSRGDF
jgi:hypothetical protein